MLASARRRAWRSADVCVPPPACGDFVGRAFSPAAWRLVVSQGFAGQRLCKTEMFHPPQTSPAGVNARPTMRGTRAAERGQKAAARFGGTMRALPPAGGVSERSRYEVPALSAEIVPYGCGARSCRVLKGYLCGKAAVHPSGCALRRIQLPLQGSLPSGRRQQNRQNKYSPEHGGSGLYCFVPRPRSGGPYSEITEANGRRDKPAHGGKPGAEAPHAASPNCAGGPLR